MLFKYYKYDVYFNVIIALYTFNLFAIKINLILTMTHYDILQVFHIYL